MKAAVVVFPGSNRERDAGRAIRDASGHEPHYVWHADHELPSGTDLVVLPGGFSYGDYLRCGAIARFSPMMQSVIEIDMTDFKIAAPAVLTIFAIPLTFSIAEGIGLGLIAAALLALGLGKPKTFTTVGYIIAGVFFLQFFKIFPFRG